MDANPTLEETAGQPVIISEDVQEDISFLNDEAVETSGLMFIEEETPPSPFHGLEDLEDILRDESKKALIEKFEPASLLDLQKIGLNVKKCTTNDLLHQLALSTPAKVNFKTRELLSEMVLLIKPSLSTNQKIGLKVVPYLKY